MSLLRRVIGGVLRRHRQRQGRTLREVAAVGRRLRALPLGGGAGPQGGLLGGARGDLPGARHQPRRPARGGPRRHAPGRAPPPGRAARRADPPGAGRCDPARDRQRHPAGGSASSAGCLLHRGPRASEPTLRVDAPASAGGSRPGPRTAALAGGAQTRLGRAAADRRVGRAGSAVGGSAGGRITGPATAVARTLEGPVHRAVPPPAGTVEGGGT